MPDTRRKDANWILNIDPEGKVSTEDARLAVLMDIRDELKRLNTLLHCGNFMAIPHYLDKIRLNTRKPVKRKLRAKG